MDKEKEETKAVAKVRRGTPKKRWGDWKVPFLAKLAECGNVTVSCRHAKISWTNAYKAKRNSKEFEEAWDDALEQAADLMEEEVARRAFKGTNKPVYQGGEKVGEITEYSDTLAMFLLKGARPEKFRDNYRMDKLLNDLIVAQSQTAKPGSRKPKGT